MLQQEFVCTYGSLHTKFILVRTEGRGTSRLLACGSKGSSAGNEGGGNGDLHGNYSDFELLRNDNNYCAGRKKIFGKCRVRST